MSDETEIENTKTIEVDTSEPQFDEAMIRAEVDATDPSEIAQTEDERHLFRFIRRRSQIVDEINRIRELTDAMVRGLESRLKGMDYVYWAEARDITRKMIEAKRGKVKSIKTPFGIAGFRTTNARLEVTDDAKLIAAAQLAPVDDPLKAAIRVKVEVSRSGVNEYFKTTGDVPAGTEVVPESEKFYVK